MSPQKTALGHLARDLEDRIEAADEEGRRRIAILVSEFAVTSVGFSDSRLRRAQEALRKRRFGSSSEREAVENLVEELDEDGWEIQKQVEAGKLAHDSYSQAWARARAAEAVARALDSDSFVAAADAVYQAYSAVDDLTVLRTVIDSALEV